MNFAQFIAVFDTNLLNLTSEYKNGSKVDIDDYFGR